MERPLKLTVYCRVSDSHPVSSCYMHKHNSYQIFIVTFVRGRHRTISNYVIMLLYNVVLHKIELDPIQEICP